MKHSAQVRFCSVCLLNTKIVKNSNSKTGSRILTRLEMKFLPCQNKKKKRRKKQQQTKTKVFLYSQSVREYYYQSFSSVFYRPYLPCLMTVKNKELNYKSYLRKEDFKKDLNTVIPFSIFSLTF